MRHRMAFSIQVFYVLLAPDRINVVSINAPGEQIRVFTQSSSTITVHQGINM